MSLHSIKEEVHLEHGKLPQQRKMTYKKYIHSHKQKKKPKLCLGWRRVNLLLSWETGRLVGLGSAPLGLGSASLALRAASLTLRVVSKPLASSGSLTSLPFPLSLATSTSWPWSPALPGLFGTLAGGKGAWVVEGCSEEVGAKAVEGGSAARTSRISAG